MGIDAIHRVLNEELLFLKNGIRTDDFREELESQWAHSATFGIKTKYIRTIYHAKLDESSCGPELPLASASQGALIIASGSIASSLSSFHDVYIFRQANSERHKLYAWLL